jgi:hypothetical protein
MVNAEDLVREQQEREHKRKKYFKKVYKLVEKRIVDSSKINLYQCYYDIPHFIINVPIYSINECREYIVSKLKSNGFKVNLISETTIIISWG